VIKAKISAVKQTKWYEYLLRFLFGGAITAIAGIIATKFGPVVGGLFLAFPAILPASATLIETHERKKKEKLGLNGRKRGRSAASADAAGAAIGSIGLLTFGGIAWIGLPRFTPALILAIATIVWFIVAALCWFIRKRV
jgi:hypothetical protein